jgi:arylsulfatase A-like enzyme
MNKWRAKKPILWAILALLVVLFSWLFWPLTSNQWNIHWDPSMSSGKSAYLDTLRNKPSRGPNVILILADDLSRNELSCYGGRDVATPHIDQLAAEGVRFQEAYVTAPICAPSRASLLTGRVNNRFGFEHQPQARYPRNRMEYFAFRYFIDTDQWQVAPQFAFPDAASIAQQGIPPGEILLPEIFQAVGYKTAMFGKWHLGAGQPFTPNARGFDTFYGFYEAFSLFADSTHPDIVNARLDEFSDKHIWSKGRDGTCAIRDNGKEVQDTGYFTFTIAQKACDFIRKNQEQPFFLYLPFNAPHTPFQAPKAYYDRFSHVQNHTRRVYLAMIAALDDAVGQVMSCLAEQGLEENTLVWFSSDNGGATYTTASWNDPLKGGKLSNWEGGLQVPFIWKWKGQIHDGQVFDLPVSLMDVFVTSLVAAGITPPKDRALDGVDLKPWLSENKPVLSPHPMLCWKSAQNKAIRQGDFKLIIDETTQTFQLYHLRTDPEEKINLVGQEPDLVKALWEAYQQWEKDMQPPLWPGIMDHIFMMDGKPYLFRV